MDNSMVIAGGGIWGLNGNRKKYIKNFFNKLKNKIKSEKGNEPTLYY